MKKVELFFDNTKDSFELAENCVNKKPSLAMDILLNGKSDDKKDFINWQVHLYARVSDIKYEEFINLYTYLEGYSPFSTQHKIKGEEFKNVLVILDNGKWNDYNFEYLFNHSHPKCNQSVLMRTQKLFYVCCTRAMENLVVYCKETNKTYDRDC